VARPLQLIAALAGLVGGLGGALPVPAPKVGICASCKLGKLQGPAGRRYCQRCAWFEAGEREQAAGAEALLGGRR